MSDTLRFILRSFATGVLCGWAVAAAVYWLDVLGLGSLIDRSPDRWILAAMVLVSVGGTFGVGFVATGLEFLASDD